MESTGKIYSIDEMHSLLAKLMERIDALSAHIRANRTGHNSSDWMDIDELREYLPGHFARSTIYEWIRDEAFPHHKHGKGFFFNRSEVDAWLMCDLGRTRRLSHT